MLRFSTSAIANDAAHKIVVVGAGTAGLTVAHQLLRKGQFKEHEIAIVDPSSKHDYQPGWTLVGGGLKTREQLRRDTASLIDPKIQFYNTAVTTFEPEQNSVSMSDGERLSYEELVVAPGISINLDGIKGLKETLANPQSRVASIYTYDSADKVYGKIKALQSGEAIFTQPSSPIKCAGAPQKIMWLAYDLWSKEGLFNKDPADSKINIDFMTGMPTMFSVPKYSEVLNDLRKERGVGAEFKHNLVAIEDNGTTAVFERPDAEPVRRSFDFLHVTPTMGPPDFLKQSPISNEAGYVAVNEGTLQHVKFANIWGIGDASSLPTSKTAAAISAQAPVLVDNLLGAMDGKAPAAVYDGYTSCPLLTEYGRVLLAEFVYGAKPKESFAGVFGLDQGKPQRAFYYMKKDFFPWVYFNNFVTGTWAGPRGWTNLSARTYSTQMRKFGAPRSFATSAAALRNRPMRRPRDPLAGNASAERAPLASGETFITRPPPSMLSGKTTADAVEPFFDASYGSAQAQQLPPEIPPRRRGARRATAQLTSAQIQDVQQLRAQDPYANTAGAIAKRFGCSPTFVRIVAPAPEKVRVARDADLGLRKATWGMNKRISREARAERRSLW